MSDIQCGSFGEYRQDKSYEKACRTMENRTGFDEIVYNCIYIGFRTVFSFTVRTFLGVFLFVKWGMRFFLTLDSERPILVKIKWYILIVYRDA